MDQSQRVWDRDLGKNTNGRHLESKKRQIIIESNGDQTKQRPENSDRVCDEEEGESKAVSDGLTPET